MSNVIICCKVMKHSVKFAPGVQQNVDEVNWLFLSENRFRGHVTFNCCIFENHLPNVPLPITSSVIKSHAYLTQKVDQLHFSVIKAVAHIPQKGHFFIHFSMHPFVFLKPHLYTSKSNCGHLYNKNAILSM